MPMKKFLQRKRKVGAGSPGDENTPSAVFTYKPRKPRLWRKCWKSVLRRSKQIHFGHLLIEFFMSGIICYVSFFVMRAINIYLEAESQVLESGQANSSQSFSSVILEALKSPKKLEELRKFFVLFLVLFHVVKLSPRLCSWAFGFMSSKGSKKERMIHGRYLLSFSEKQKALDGFDKAMCKIFRDGYTASGFVIRYDSANFLVTSIHTFFEGNEINSSSSEAYKLLLPDGLNLSETMRNRILETYNFEFCSGTKHGRSILHNSEGVPNLFANTVRDILVLRLYWLPKGVQPIEVSQHIKDKSCAEWVNAAVELLGYHERILKYSSGTILSTDNAEEGCFHYCANTEPGFSGGPVLVALPNTEHSQLLSLCPLAVHTTAGRDDEPYNIGFYLWPFLMDIKKLRQFWSSGDQRRQISTEEKEILDKERMVVRSMTFKET